MKNRKMIFISALLLVIPAAGIQAQPFGVGTPNSGAIRSINCDTTGVSEGQAGANVTWTISILPHDTAQFSSKSVLPSTTPFAASFPTATGAYSNEGSVTQYTYYRSADDSVILLGFADSLKTVVFSDPLLTAISTLAFGGSFTDNYEYLDSTTVAGETFLSKFTGTQTVTFDGTGTLVLPWKTFNHAMRFKTTSSLTDSTRIGSILSSTLTTERTVFNWLDTTLPGNYGFFITRSATSSIISTTTSNGVTYTEPIATNVVRSLRRHASDTPAIVTVSPFDNAVAIRIRSNTLVDRILFTAYDLRGKTAASAVCKPGSAGLVKGFFDTPLANGIYCYSLTRGTALLGRGKMFVR